MPPSDSETKESPWHTFLDWLEEGLNFYRVHIIVFTFTPLIFSGIFYASNGSNHIAYIDALFNCVSAMTVCGIATVDLSGITPWQQTILFIQMCLGNPVIVSWVVVYARRRMFALRCEDIVRAAARKVGREHPSTEVQPAATWASRIKSALLRGPGLPTIQERNEDESNSRGNTLKGNGNESRKLRPDMIRRMNDAPKLVNPSGWISEGRTDPINVDTVEPKESDKSSSPSSQEAERQLASSDEASERIAPSDSSNESNHGGERPSKLDRRLSDPGERSRRPSPIDRDYQRFPTFATREPSSPSSPRSPGFPRNQTIEFAPTPHRESRSTERGRMDRPSGMPDMNSRRPTMDTIESDASRAGAGTIRRAVPMQQSGTYQSTRSVPSHHQIVQGDFGGFPWPWEVLSRLVGRFFPRLKRHLSRTVTMPRTRTIASQYGPPSAGARVVPYISFDAVVGRNSVFQRLTSEQIEELGGVEFRALTALLWIVAGYHILIQLVALTIIGPYISYGHWKNILKPPQQHRDVAPGWFSVFQVVSTYTNTGISLCDESMIPFQMAYPMIVVMIFLILAGNTGFPVFLRFFIWVFANFVPTRSRIHETLHFLLDHPRRCFIYLFPSHQTWFLLAVLIILNGTDWVGFLVLDIGTPVVEALPRGVRVIDGLLQAAAVRSSGFAIVTLSAIAPGTKVLYVIMMYISVYPIAMSVRSTNVYEEKSLGIYTHDGDDEEDRITTSGGRMTVWSRYLSMHMRRQLAFDMWWICLALLLVCIVERGNLNNPDNQSWFTIFNILFELVSAYGTVGMSLGIPYANYSLSGAFSPLSKLIVCIVMLRGRHRGLPVAIDRAVMLPFEFRQGVEEGDNHSPAATRRRSRSFLRVPTISTGHNVGVPSPSQSEKPGEPGRPEARRRPSRWTLRTHTRETQNGNGDASAPQQ